MTPYRATPPANVVPPDEALARAKLGHELIYDEDLLWAARPRLGLLFEWNQGIVFFLFWTVAGIVMTVIDFLLSGRVAKGGLFFLGVGVVFLVALLIGAAVRRARTFYGITNYRLLILSPHGLKEHWLALILQMSVKEGSRGFGTFYMNAPYVGKDGKRKYSSPEMTHVSNAVEVHRILREAMAAASHAAEER